MHENVTELNPNKHGVSPAIFGHRSWRIVVFITAVVLALVGLAVSLHDVKKFGGIDLVARLTGGYALLYGFDPYFHTLQQEAVFPVQYPDRDDFISRCTYTPSLLQLYLLTSKYDYITQRWIWFGLEWISLFVAIACASLLVPKRIRVIFCSAALVFFAGGIFWRLHVERGQYYVFVSMFLALAAFTFLKWRRCSWVGGMLHGIIISWRPTMLIFALPRAFALKRRAWMEIAVPLLTAGCIMLFLVAKYGIEPFRSFVTMAAYWQQRTLDKQLTNGHLAAPSTTRNDVAREPKIMSEEYLNYVSVFLDVFPAETSVGRMVGGFIRGRGGEVDADMAIKLIWWFKVAALAYLATAGAFLSSMAWMGRQGTPRLQLAAGLLVSITLGHFAPVRWEYADVIYLPLLALLAPQIFSERRLYMVAASILLIGFSLGSLPIDLVAVWPGRVRSVCVLIAAHLLVIGAYLHFPQGSGLLFRLKSSLHLLPKMASPR